MLKLYNYIDKYNEFARTFTAAMLASIDNENVVISPLSLVTLLCMAAKATGGSTSEEILGCISGGRSLDVMTETVKDMLEYTGRTGSLKSANAVCVKQEIRSSIMEEYVNSLKKDFGGDLFASEHLVRDVNRWVNINTNGMIDRIMDEDNPDMLACLLNAVAFEAEWEEQYEEYDIYEEEFTNADKTKIYVDMLHSSEECYIEDSNYTGFVKPYKGLEYSFMALLPKKKGMRLLVHSLKTTDFSKLFEKSTAEKVYVTMPEFRYTCGGDITDICKALGIKQVFRDDADFSPMTSAWIKLDSIIHKARIELDRKGTKAAAVTAAWAVEGCAMIMEEPKQVVLDRPFVYAIVHNRTGLPVFTGVVSHLQPTERV